VVQEEGENRAGEMIRRLSLLSLLLGGVIQLSAQVPNASFEQWSDGNPVGWRTSNNPPQLITVKRITDAREGSAAVRGEVVKAFGMLPVPPALTSGNDDADGFPVEKRYAFFRGYYQFTSVGGDQMLVTIAMLKNGETIGGGLIYLSAQNTYAPFNIPITYTTKEIPDAAIIAVVIMHPSVLTHEGSFFVVDDFRLCLDAAECGDAPVARQRIDGIVWGRGAPVANAVVVYKPIGKEFRGVPVSPFAPQDSVSVESDLQGRFSIPITFEAGKEPTATSPYHFTLSVHPTGQDTQRFLERTDRYLMTEESLLGLVVYLQPTVSVISGTVVSSLSDEPLPQMVVVVQDTSDRTYRAATLTGGDGRFRFEIDGGRTYRIELHNEMYEARTRHVFLNYNTERSVGAIAASRRQGRVDIYVGRRTYESNHVPLEGATIFVLDEANYQRYVDWKDSVVFSDDEPPVRAIRRLTTGVDGKASVTLEVHDSNFPNAPYYFVMRKARYNDAAANRTLPPNTTRSISFITESRRAIIYGTVRREDDLSPLSNAKVELVEKFRSGACVTLRETWTQSDGRFQFHDVPDASYCYLRVTHTSSVTSTAAQDLVVTPGAIIPIEISLPSANGSVQGTVTDDTGRPVYGVLLGYGDNSTTSDPSGAYLLRSLPPGRANLYALKDGYTVVTMTIDVRSRDTTRADVRLTPHRGDLILTVLTRINSSLVPLPGATVTVDGYGSRTTGNHGTVDFLNLPVDDHEVLIRGPQNQNYVERNTTVSVPNAVLRVNQVLEMGGSITGTVRDDSGEPKEGALVEVVGSPGTSTHTDAAGRYTLRGVAGMAVSSSGETSTVQVSGRSVNVSGLSFVRPVIKASLAGHRSSSQTVELSPGDNLTNVDFVIENLGFSQIFGFNVSIDDVNVSGNTKTVSGEIVDIPNTNNIVTLGAGVRLPFSNLQLDANTNRPRSNDFPLDVGSIPVRLHGVQATITGGGAGNVRVYYSNNVGSIRGDIEVKTRDIFMLLPASSWGNEVIPRPTSHTAGPCITSTGSNYATTPIRFANTPAQRSLWGFSVEPNFNTTEISSNGITIRGSIPLPGLSSFQLQKLWVDANGRVVADSVEIAVGTISLGVMRLTNSRVTLTPSGIVADGGLTFSGDLGGVQVSYSSLRIASDGRIVSANLSRPASSLSMSGISLENIPVPTLTSNQQGELLLRLSGDVRFPGQHFTQTLSISSLMIDQHGGIGPAGIAANTRLNFAGIVDLHVQRLEFSNDSRGRFTRLVGGFLFDIPAVSVQTGNLRFYQNGHFEVDRIGFSFDAGPASVAANLNWRSTRFSGDASLSVGGMFSVDAGIEYTNSTSWMVEIAADVNIPISPPALEITNVGGALAREGNAWIVRINGDLSGSGISTALALRCTLSVKAGGSGGPTIEGSGTLTAFGSLSVGEASLLLDFPRSHFIGNVSLSIPTALRSFVRASGRLDIDITPSSFFAGVTTDLTLLKIINGGGKFYIGHEHTCSLCPVTHLHTFDVLGHPQNRAITGIHVEASVWEQFNVAVVRGSMQVAGYFVCDWGTPTRPLQIAGGGKFYVSGTVDLEVVSATGSVTVEGAIAYSQGEMTINGRGTLFVEGCLLGECASANLSVDVQYTTSPPPMSPNLRVRVCHNTLGCGSITL
jgi:hypothetical protein